MGRAERRVPRIFSVLDEDGGRVKAVWITDEDGLKVDTAPVCVFEPRWHRWFEAWICAQAVPSGDAREVAGNGRAELAPESSESEGGEGESAKEDEDGP